MATSDMPRKELECPNHCGGLGIHSQNIAHHLSEECLLRSVDCDYQHAGCHIELKFVEMAKHNLDFHQEHFDLMSDKLKVVMKENGDLRQKAEKLGKYIDDLVNLIKNLDRTEFEVVVRMVTSKDNKRCTPTVSDSSTHSLLVSSMPEVVDNNYNNKISLSKSRSCPPSVKDKCDRELKSDHHRTVLHDNNGEKFGKAVNQDVLHTKVDMGTVVPKPAVLNTTLPGSANTYPPPSEKPSDSGIYEDIEHFKPPGGVPEGNVKKSDLDVIKKAKVSRYKSVGIRSPFLSDRRRNSTPTGKSRLPTATQIVHLNRLKESQTSTGVDGNENVDQGTCGAVGNGINTNAESNIYDNPVRKRSSSEMTYPLLHGKLEAEASGALNDTPSHVPLPQDYAEPIQTRSRQRLQSQIPSSRLDEHSSNINIDHELSREEIGNKIKLPVPYGFAGGSPRGQAKIIPRLARKVPMLPVTSKRLIMGPNPGQEDGEDVQPSSTDYESVTVDQGQIMRSYSSANAKSAAMLSKKPSSTVTFQDARSESPRSESPHKAGARIPRSTSKLALSKPVGRSVSGVRRKLRVVNELVSLKTDSPPSLKPLAHSKNWKSEPRLQEASDCVMPLDGSKQTKNRMLKMKKSKRSSAILF